MNIEEYKLNLLDRNYTKWNIYNNKSFDKLDLEKINPFENKLFNDDVFAIDADGNVSIIHSVARLTQNIPAVLILSGNKSYGRHNKSKLYYRCIPNDNLLPIFLIPYEMQFNFSKKYSNKYVTMNFAEWNDVYPHGVINQIIGDVDVLVNFYEYQLYCKSLNVSIQYFQRQTLKQVSKYGGNLHEIIDEISAKYPQIEDRTLSNVVTIDNSNTTDYDDAFSIIDDEINNIYILSIYISNVSLILDHLNLWDSFSNRVSTIYLPDKKKPMLPCILSDNLCSLKVGTKRIALTLDIYINKISFEIIKMQYCNSLILVKHNYIYEDPLLLNSDIYMTTSELVKKLSEQYIYTKHVKDSHDVIAYLMIFMNYHTSLELVKCKNGIYRTNTNITNNVDLKTNLHINDENIQDDVMKNLMNWNSSISQYSLSADNLRNEALNIDAYIHITSPIRRLVDLLNIIKIQHNLGLVGCEMGSVFYDKWITQLDYINNTMKNIKKVQNSCNLLAMCVENITICNFNYDGYCFNKILRNCDLYQYFVYLPQLKIICKLICRNNMDEYSKHSFKLYIFQDEDKIKKKIKIQLLDE